MYVHTYITKTKCREQHLLLLCKMYLKYSIFFFIEKCFRPLRPTHLFHEPCRELLPTV